MKTGQADRSPRNRLAGEPVDPQSTELRKETEMIRLNRSAAAGIGLALLCAAAPLAAAQDAAVPARTAGGMQYVNGGFGDDEAATIKQTAPNYSLRMQFSRQHNSEFVAGVDLAIRDQAGRTVFALPSAGPLTDVMLPPGSYQVSASYEGRTETQQISVGGPGRAGKDISFRWQGTETP
jgi:hypothetical protein